MFHRNIDKLKFKSRTATGCVIASPAEKCLGHMKTLWRRISSHGKIILLLRQNIRTERGGLDLQMLYDAFGWNASNLISLWTAGMLKIVIYSKSSFQCVDVLL